MHDRTIPPCDWCGSDTRRGSNLHRVCVACGRINTITLAKTKRDNEYTVKWTVEKAKNMKIEGESFSEYMRHRRDYISSHDMAVYRLDPALYWFRMTSPERQDTAAMRFGRLLHMAVLEPQTYFASTIVEQPPINQRTGKPYGRDTQAYADYWHNACKDLKGAIELVDQAEAELIATMRSNILSHQYASMLLNSCPDRECVFRILDGYGCNAWCQARVDAIGESVLIDLKSCDNLDNFERDIRKYEYVNQIAHYYECVHRTNGSSPSCYLIAAEKQEPNRVGVWRLAPQDLALAEEQNEDAARRIVAGDRTGKYDAMLVYGCDDTISVDNAGRINL